MGIIAVMVGMGLPWFITITKSSSMTSTVNSFLADVRFARSEALRRGGSVVMCRSNAPDAATPKCNGNTSATTGWQSGWIIFHDRSNPANNDFDTTTDTMLRVQSPITSMDSIIEAGGSPSYKFIFSPTGRLTVSTAATLNFGNESFKNYRNPDNIFNLQRVVCVAVTGRARIAGDGTATCP